MNNKRKLSYGKCTMIIIRLITLLKSIRLSQDPFDPTVTMKRAFVETPTNKLMYGKSSYYLLSSHFKDIQGVIESCTDILTTSYWLHVELGKNI
jgi:hypothetical protein